MNNLTHINENGKAKMIDVSEKDITNRTAVARGIVKMNKTTMDQIQANLIKKGDVLAIANIAGIMAAKRTDKLIPLCHTLPLSSVKIQFTIENDCDLIITAECKCNYVTGVEMEALTAVSVAALTIYDMCKAIDKSIEINNICLVSKTGGKSGIYINNDI